MEGFIGPESRRGGARKPTRRGRAWLSPSRCALNPGAPQPGGSPAEAPFAGSPSLLVARRPRLVARVRRRWRRRRKLPLLLERVGLDQRGFPARRSGGVVIAEHERGRIDPPPRLLGGANQPGQRFRWDGRAVLVDFASLDLFVRLLDLG